MTADSLKTIIESSTASSMAVGAATPIAVCSYRLKSKSRPLKSDFAKRPLRGGNPPPASSDTSLLNWRDISMPLPAEASHAARRSTLWLRIARWLNANPGRSCADIARGVGGTQNNIIAAMSRLSALGMLWSRSEGNTKLWWAKDNYAVLAVRATEREQLERVALKQRHQAEKAAARAKKEARLTSLRQVIQAERARQALEKQAREKEEYAAWALEKQRQATQAAALKAAAAAQAKQERAEQQERAARNRHGLTPEDAAWMAYYRTPREQRRLLQPPRINHIDSRTI